MRGGRIAEQGTFEELREDADGEMVRNSTCFVMLKGRPISLLCF
jgi:hypothetical protein